MNCEDVKLYYFDYLENRDVPVAVGEHITQCSDCRAAIERLKEELSLTDTVEKPWRPDYLEQHYRLLNEWITCQTVRPFLPSLLTPQLGVTRPTPVTVHLENCPACKRCVNVIRSLELTSSELIHASRYLAGEPVELDSAARKTLDTIKQAKMSDVATRMRLPESECLSEDAMIDVEHRKPSRRPVPKRSVSLWITGGIAAAVVFVIVLLVPTDNLKALDVEQLYTTLENVRNVYIEKYAGSEELERILISDGLGAYLFQHDDQAVLINKDTGNVYRHQDGEVQILPEINKMELERPWGLLPFKHISQLPASYDWTYMGDTVLDGELNVRIYEWTWTESPNNQFHIKHIWRGYLDPHSYLPYRIESLDELNDAPAELIMEMKVSYPSDAECRRIIESNGFKGLVYGDQEDVFKTAPVASKLSSTEDGLILSTWSSAKTALNLPRE